MSFISMLSIFSTIHFRILFVVGLVMFMTAMPAIAQHKDSLIVTGDSSSLSILQKDTTIRLQIDSTKTGLAKKDSVKKRIWIPRTAAIRSAILPGLGQVYNRKYWKVGLVYAALGVTGYVFFNNLKTYKESRFAYKARITAATAPVPPLVADSTDYNKLSPEYQTLYTLESIKANRNQFRRYIDYSVLVFVLLWGLNVLDATVDAHLKSFDVSPDLTLKFKAGHSEIAGTNGFSLVLTLKNHHSR